MVHTTPAPLRLSHLSLGVTDLDVAHAFYRDVMGLPTERRDDSVCVRWPDFLFILETAPPAERSKFHFGFRVESPEEVDKWNERFRAAGTRILAGPSNRDGDRALFVADPDNYTIEIFFEPS